MASIAEIQRLVERIHEELPFLIQRSQITPKQVVTVAGLSDITERLGLVQAGEFRAGNGLEPGYGFTGGRYGYPGFTYGSTEYFLAGVKNDILQVGLSLENGAITAGAGDVSVDADGVWVTNQQAAFGFEDTNGDRFNIYLLSDGTDNLVLKNQVGNIRMEVDSTDGEVLVLSLEEELGAANIPYLRLLNTEPTSTGAVFALDAGIVITAGIDGRETVFNEDSFDINFRIESATDQFAFFLDAGGEAIQFFGGSAATFNHTNKVINLGSVIIVDYGTEDRFEIGADHFFPTRNSSNPNGFWNEANEDMNFTFESVNQSQVSHMDAGLDKYTSIIWDGWGMRDEAWTRTGNHTFTVSGDVTAIYRKGTKVRYNDGAVEYGVIASSSHAAGTTTVNLIPNTDYAMAAATINDRYISYIDNPEGFPASFNFTGTISAASGTITTSSLDNAKWTAKSGQIMIGFQITITTAGTGTGNLRLTTPATPVGTWTGSGRENQVTGVQLQTFVVNGGSNINIVRYDNSTVIADNRVVLGSIVMAY